MKMRLLFFSFFLVSRPALVKNRRSQNGKFVSNYSGKKKMKKKKKKRVKTPSFHEPEFEYQKDQDGSEESFSNSSKTRVV